MPKDWDTTAKKMLRDNADDFVALVQKGLRVGKFLPTELDNEHVHADGLL